MLAPGDNNSPDVITSVAGELESGKGLLMGGRDQINNLLVAPTPKKSVICTKEQISFLKTSICVRVDLFLR